MEAEKGGRKDEERREDGALGLTRYFYILFFVLFRFLIFILLFFSFYSLQPEITNVGCFNREMPNLEDCVVMQFHPDARLGVVQVSRRECRERRAGRGMSEKSQGRGITD